ncbi:hypothetical protein D3C74_428170 [compost metagenome]
MHLQKHNPVVTSFDFVVNRRFQPEGGLFNEQSALLGNHGIHAEESIALLRSDLRADPSIEIAENRNTNVAGLAQFRPGVGGLLDCKHHQCRLQRNPDSE